jgi:hypothetical protein
VFTDDTPWVYIELQVSPPAIEITLVQASAGPPPLWIWTVRADPGPHAFAFTHRLTEGGAVITESTCNKVVAP